MIKAPSTTEDRYTKPSEWCSRPDLWHAIDASSPEEEVLIFLAGLVRLMKPNFCLVANSGMGRVVEAIGLALSQNNHGLVAWMDADKDMRDLTKDQCRYLSRVVYWDEARSWDTDTWKSELFFVDDYSPRRAMRDMKSKLGKNSVVAFHDTAPGRCLDEIIQLEIDKVISDVWNFGTPRGLSIARVA